MNPSRIRGGLFYLVFFFSGAAGLGYQLTWLRMLTPGFGHEMPATLACVSAFMGGMGLGAWIFDKAIGRTERPGRWYAMLEIVIGVWALFSFIEIPLLNQAAWQAIGIAPSFFRHWAVAFLFPFLAILPATAAMGATLPAMERLVRPFTTHGRCVGAIYAANTLGAVGGILLSTMVVSPHLGLRETVGCLGAINLLCGAAALFLSKQGLAPKLVPVPQKTPAVSVTILTRRLTLTIFLTGLLGIGYETLGVRVLSQVLENTIYSFAAVLSIFLLGTAIGAALYQRLLRNFNPQLLLGGLLFGLSFAGLLGIHAMARAQLLYDACRNTAGDTPCGVWAAELMVAAAVFAVPTILMGALFSHLIQTARGTHGGVGRAAALNTFGGALAPV